MSAILPKRGRLRFEEVEYRPLPDGSHRVRVELEWEGDRFTGEAVGSSLLEGNLRAAAEATIAAASRATAGRVALGLVGIKAVRAFDGRVTIAAVEARGEGRRYQLLGAHAFSHDDLSRAAVLTVLDALNRVLEPFMESERGSK